MEVFSKIPKELKINVYQPLREQTSKAKIKARKNYWLMSTLAY